MPPLHRAPEQAVTREPTVPDPAWLWRAFAVWAEVRPADQRQASMLWRITRSDWEYLQTTSAMPPDSIGHPLLQDRARPTLWGIDVDVVPDAPGRFPELVWIIDRRN